MTSICEETALELMPLMEAVTGCCWDQCTTEAQVRLGVRHWDGFPCESPSPAVLCEVHSEHVKETISALLPGFCVRCGKVIGDVADVVAYEMEL